MSGGHWNYAQYQLNNILLEASSDAEINKRFPNLAKALKESAKVYYEILHTIDYDFCDDAYINSDELFEQEALTKIHSITENLIKN